MRLGRSARRWVMIAAWWLLAACGDDALAVDAAVHDAATGDAGMPRVTPAPANEPWERLSQWHLFEDIEGMELVTARSATEGLVLTRALCPQVILMDINLPDMSGSQALQVLRRSPETADIPVIALTAAASDRDRKAGLQVGFYRYITKPIDVEELMKALDAALRHAGTRAACSPLVP